MTREVLLFVGILTIFVVLVSGGPVWSAEKGQSIGASVQQDRQRVVYKPRAIGAPERRVGAASRAPADRKDTLGEGSRALMIAVLTPKEIGLTIKVQPTLYWFASRPISQPTNLIVEEQGEHERPVVPIVNYRIPGGIAAGIHPISLERLGVKLEPDKNYAWSVEVVLDPDRPSKNLVATGGLQPIAPSEALRTRLRSSKSEEHPALYAEAGIWYEALSALSDLIAAHPRDPIWRQERSGLLQQVDLPEAAAFDLGQSSSL